MTTQAIAIEGGVGRSESRLEVLVDRVIEALFGVQQEEMPVPAPTVAKSVHDARRLRRAGDLDGALSVMSEVDTPNAPVRDACWAYSEWLDLVRRRFGKKGVHGLQPRLRPGCGPGLPGRVHAGGRRRAGNALAARQGGLQGEPPGPQGPGEGRRVMVLATAPVDIPVLKARYSLGAVVEESGVRLREAGAGFDRASAPSTKRSRAASRCTATRSDTTASAAGLEETSWTSCRGSRA